MVMTNKEILREYKEAKCPSKQIKVLAELNATSKANICEILAAQGVAPCNLPWLPKAIPETTEDHSQQAKADANPYWANVNEMALKQREKGISKYGQGLEDNPMTIRDRVVYLQEELIDGLMYCEHIKAYMEGQTDMTANGYQELALRTLNKELNNREVLNDGALGLTGESGECADIVKKHLFQGHNLDKAHLAKELGDVAWYLAVTAHVIGYTLEEVLLMNVEKLRERYPEGFDEFRSRNRKTGDV